MKDHPHFAYNQKQVLQDIVINLINKQNELGKLIDDLKRDKNGWWRVDENLNWFRKKGCFIRT